jgi:acetylornithine deacetylase/succinyl-diaminopimelate desuccinylase-like protein
LEEWTSPPFAPTIYDGILRCRGVADNKGNIIARLYAIRAYQEVKGRLPISIKFCIEGEEEIGSPNLTAFVEQNRLLLKADACIWEGGSVNWQGQPVITFGVKGLLYVELVARGAARDVHSSLATVVPNPAWRLVWSLNSLKDKDERIRIDGFYDAIRPPSQKEVEAVKAIPLEEQELKENLGLRRFLLGLSGVEFGLRHFFEPTCNICGLTSGYGGEGSKTVLPCVARAKIDFRLVPDQRPEDVLTKLRRHLDENGFDDIDIVNLSGENPARTPLDSPFGEVVCQTAREVYGLDPVIEPTMAATGPMSCFTDMLGIPTVCMGIEYPDNRAHAPDENIRLTDFVKGTKHVAAVLDRLGKMA